ncbi:Glycine-rich protein 2 [Diplonema papillatum]|nr:Glycine-rich protein 2 [Diplonema papillatum]
MDGGKMEGGFGNGSAHHPFAAAMQGGAPGQKGGPGGQEQYFQGFSAGNGGAKGGGRGGAPPPPPQAMYDQGPGVGSHQQQQQPQHALQHAQQQQHQQQQFGAVPAGGAYHDTYQFGHGGAPQQQQQPQGFPPQGMPPGHHQPHMMQQGSGAPSTTRGPGGGGGAMHNLNEQFGNMSVEPSDGFGQSRAVMLPGVVKRWNLDKGYGFLQPMEGGDDVFVHHTVVYSRGFRSLLEGSEVEYECMKVSDSRVRATRVTGPGGSFCKSAPRPLNPPLVDMIGEGPQGAGMGSGQPTIPLHMVQLPVGSDQLPGVTLIPLQGGGMQEQGQRGKGGKQGAHGGMQRGGMQPGYGGMGRAPSSGSKGHDDQSASDVRGDRGHGEGAGNFNGSFFPSQGNQQGSFQQDDGSDFVGMPAN